MATEDIFLVTTIVVAVLSLLYADKEFFLVLSRRDRLGEVLFLTLVFGFGLIGSIMCAIGWLTGDTWTNTIVYTVGWAIPAVVGIFVSEMRASYGPDWRMGLRRYLKWTDSNNEWHPPPGTAWDGSTADSESDHIHDLRRRYPAWFKFHHVTAPGPSKPANRSFGAARLPKPDL